MSWAAWKRQRPADHTRRGSDQLSNLEKTCWATCWAVYMLCSVFQFSCFHEFSLKLDWALVMLLFCVNFCSCKQPLTHTPVFNPSKTHWFTKLECDNILTSVHYWFPVWEVSTFVHISPGTVSHSTLCFRVSLFSLYWPVPILEWRRNQLRSLQGFLLLNFSVTNFISLLLCIKH